MSTLDMQSTAWHLPPAQANGLVTALGDRAEALVDDLVQTIAATPKVVTEPVWMPPPVVGRERCVANVRSVLAATVSSSGFDAESAIENGADRARQGMTVSTLIESDRIAFRRLWRLLVDEADLQSIDAKIVQQLTANLHLAEELFATAMFSGYRDQQQRQLLQEMSHGTLMIDTLLKGHAHDAWRLWEIANDLRLPTEGPFAVIAAELPCAGYEALPDIESKLRSLDIFSAWRLLPDLHVGIAHIASDRHRDNILSLLTRMATRRIGVSACYDDLRDTPVALHFAKVSLRGHDRADGKISVFDGSMLATAAVSAPSVMVKSAAIALDGFADLPPAEREMLFDTFRVWVDNDESVRASAEILFVHPNTVRKRLHRIEQRTGRSLSRSRDVIELSLALEVHRRLM